MGKGGEKNPFHAECTMAIVGLSVHLTARDLLGVQDSVHSHPPELFRTSFLRTGHSLAAQLHLAALSHLLSQDTDWKQLKGRNGYIYLCFPRLEPSKWH